MPEALAVLLVFFVCVLVYAIAKVQSRNPELHHPTVVREQLNQHQAWLQERLRQADEEKWDSAMREQIAEQLAETSRKLAQLPS